jgi:DNA-binding PadR family transcriptional regulator
VETEIDLSNVNRLYTIMLLESGKRHGYQIIKDIEELTGKKPSTSHIYPFLSKLERKGLVESEEKGERGKKVYNLTDEGGNIVKEQIEAFGEILSSAIEGEITECSHVAVKSILEVMKRTEKFSAANTAPQILKSKK